MGRYRSGTGAQTGATVVSYDRAGFGKSDLPDSPCDMKVEAGWLWKSLKHLGFEKDIILVGHSYGGWMIRIEASENPDAVSGIVFIDPFSVEFVDLLGVEYLDQHPMTGKLPFDTSQPEKLTKTTAGPGAHGRQRSRSQGGDHEEDRRSEGNTGLYH